MSGFSDISRRIRSINARITTVGRIYGKDSAIYQRIISTVQKAGGKTRFRASMFEGNLRQIAKATRALETIENSAYTTKAGRQAIGQKARETFAQNNPTYDEKTIVKMYDTFKNSSFSRFEEVYKYSSELFVDAIMTAYETDGKMTKRKMNEKIDYFLSHLEEFNGGVYQINPNNDSAIAVENFKKWLSQ